MDEVGSYTYRKTTHVATGDRYVGPRSVTLFTASNKSFDSADCSAILVGHAARESHPD